MALTLTAAQQTAKTADTPEPFYLVELGFDTILYHTSAEGTVTWAAPSPSIGATWTPSGIRVEHVTPISGGGGGKSCAISLPDESAVYFGIVRADMPDDRILKIWELHGEPTVVYVTADAVCLFDGFMNGRIPRMAERIVIEGLTHSSRTQKTPRRTVGPPACNHLPEHGDKMNFHGTEFIVSRPP